MFTQDREETSLAFGNDLDECVLENLYERQGRKSTLMKNALSLYQSDNVLKKEPRRYPKLRTTTNDILEHQQQNMLFSQKGVLKETEQHQRTLREE